MRDLLYGEIRMLRDFPYSQKADLRKRIKSRRGESVVHKLANDVYSLVNILDGGSFDELKDMLSQAPKCSKSEMNSSMANAQKNASSIDILSATVTQMKADLLQLKEKSRQMDILHKDVESMKTKMETFMKESDNAISELKQTVYENSQAIDRMHDNCSSDITKMKNDTKQLRAELQSRTCEVEDNIHKVTVQMEKQSKNLDKRMAKIEARIRGLDPVSCSVQNKLPADDNKGSDLKLLKTQCQNTVSESEDVILVKESKTIGSNPRNPERQLLHTNTASGSRFYRADSSPSCNTSFTDVLKATPINDVGGDEKRDVTPRENVSSGVRQSGSNMLSNKNTNTMSVRFNNREQSQRDANPREKSSVLQSYQSKVSTSNLSPRNDKPQSSSSQSTQQADTDDHEDHMKEDMDGFIQHVRKKTKRFFLGGFKPSISEALIKGYIDQCGGPKVDSFSNN